MAYPTKLLNDDETVALDLHPHWSFLARPVVALVASIVLSIVVLVAMDGSNTRRALMWVLLAAIVVSAVWLVIRYFQWVTTNFVVTSDRVIYRHGMIAKSGIEIPLDRVNNVIFNQSIFERMVGAGDLLVESGGETGQQRFTDVRDPDHVQKVIHVQKAARDGRIAGRGGGIAIDVATQLEKLEGLLERGTITREEFDVQKAKLLGA